MCLIVMVTAEKSCALLVPPYTAVLLCIISLSSRFYYIASWFKFEVSYSQNCLAHSKDDLSYQWVKNFN